MKTFTEKQNEILQTQTAEILDNIADGQSIRDILARIYVENLDEKTMKQGEIMADAILQGIKDFDADYREAQENLDHFIKRFQDEVDADKSCVERCNYWLKMGAAISAATKAMGEDNADREQILYEIEDLAVSDEEATPEREKEFRELAMEAIKNSGVMLFALTEQAHALEEMTADEAAGMLIDLGNKEIEYRAIVAMLAYTKIKNGEFEDVPVEMTAAQVAAVVCAEIEQSRIMDAVGKGNLAVDIASYLLGVLGVVVLIKIAIVVTGAALDLVAGMFGVILTIPACLMVVAGICWLMMKAADAWFEESKYIVETTCLVIKNVIKGIRIIADYVIERVIPAIIEKAKEVYSKLRKHRVKDVKVTAPVMAD